MNAATVLQWALGIIAVAALLVVGFLLDRLTQRPKSVDAHGDEAIDGVREFCCPRHPGCTCASRRRAELRAKAVRERGVPAGMWRSFVRNHDVRRTP